MPVVRRQHGLAARTPRTVAVYRPLRLEPIPSPSLFDWVVYYAFVGSIWDFYAALFVLGLWFIPQQLRDRIAPDGFRY